MERSKDLIEWEWDEDNGVMVGSNLLRNSSNGSPSCPVCSRNFPLDKIEAHVNECLTMDEQQADPFSIPADVEFDNQLRADKKKKEEDDYRLVMEMLDEEKRVQKRKQDEISNASFVCSKCTTGFANFEAVNFLDSCGHCFCKPCLREHFMSKVEANKCSEICCPSCNKYVSVAEIKEILPAQDYEKYEKNTLMEAVGSNANLVSCPNPKCGNIIEKMRPGVINEEAKELDPAGNALSREAVVHKNENRFRCRECQTEFCSSCKSIPYHLGFTCEKFKSYQKAKHCRFCNVQLTQVNKAQPASKEAALEDVCNGEDCLERRGIACGKVLKCNHPCGGVKGRPCPPCIKDGCDEKNNEAQKSEDYCNICWSEELGSSPSIKLECGHFFHYLCAKKKINLKWTGSRITFGFLECALCKAKMANAALADDLKPIEELYQEVSTKAVERLKMLDQLKSDEITKKESKFYQKPQEYAMYRFSYFPCFKCKKPYFGGEKVCEAAVADFNPKELICGGCSEFAAQENCPKHGKEYIEYKCRFCCNVSVWFCFGTTHFCDDCHKKAGTIVNEAKNKLPKCTCTIKHPPNGEEFLLGCSMCRLNNAYFN